MWKYGTLRSMAGKEPVHRLAHLALPKRQNAACLLGRTLHLQGRYEASRIKRALALVRDHAAILRMHEENTAGSFGQRSRAGKRRPSLQGETVEMNPRIALGAKIAILQVFIYSSMQV